MKWEYGRLTETSTRMSQGGAFRELFVARWEGPEGIHDLARTTEDDGATVRRLQALGSDGWELVTSTIMKSEDGQSGLMETYLFKREAK